MADRDSRQAKRRKTRKGTRSCWECKHRKIRCIFTAPEDAVCASCARRCKECVSQQFPDQTTPERSSRLVGDRFQRMEAMIATLAKQPLVIDSRSPNSLAASISAASISAASVSAASEPTPGRVDEAAIPGFFVYEDKLRTPASSPDAIHPQVIIAPIPTPAATSTKARDVARTLLAAYPGEAFIKLFLNMYLTMYHSYRDIDVWIDLPDHERPDYHLLHTRHTAESHPAVIAEQMLILANVLQQAGGDTLAKLEALSDEPPQAVMARLATTATAMVTTHNMILDTCEGMTCLILDSIYQANQGNVRRAWLAHRRIVSIAQALGLHRRPYRALSIKSIQSSCILDPRFLWHRLVHSDRVLSLMLGLPVASSDSSMVSEAALTQDTPMGQLERRHAFAAGQILERNDREPTPEDYDLTQRIDADLQKAANNMPSRWWLEPAWKPALTSTQRFWESRRLLNQIYHFYLLHQLHLPYMVIGSAPSEANQSHYEYSRSTCISASRDILTRCLNNIAQDGFVSHCRLLDFLALMSSLTLLLSHLYARGTGPFYLAHQRLSDRGMIEQLLEALEVDGPVDGGESKIPAAKMIRQLLEIDASLDSGFGSGTPDSSSSGTVRPHDAEPIRFFVPCFGVLNISRDGKITFEGNSTGDSAGDFPQPQGQTYDGGSSGRAAPMHGVSADIGTLSMDSSHDGLLPVTSNPSSLEDSNAWALQGVDFAFFESLLRESSAQVGDNGGGNLWASAAGM